MLTELSALHPLAQLVLKATVLLLATTIAAMLLRKRSAALRHLLWLCCAGGLLVLPLLTLALPSLELPVISVAVEEVESGPSPAATNSASIESKPEANRMESLFESSSAGRQENTPVINSTTTTAGSKGATRGPSGIAFGVVWFIGTALLLASRLAGDRYLSKVIRRCHLVGPNQAPTSVLSECASALGLRMPALLTSKIAPLPFACGPFRSKIILPEAATEWDTEKLRPILMHEMAHIKRFDCLTQFVAHCARALFWFHPLTWWMTREMHIEREIACDDMVLQTGHEPSRYGKVLLRLATETDSPAYLPAGAIAMAGKSTLERRIRALIDPLRNRRGLSRKVLAAAFGVTALIAASLAVLQVGVQASNDTLPLAHQPHKLPSLPTEKLIRIGVSEPELPWAWQELRTRAEGGKFTNSEAESLLTGLTVSMRAHPYGYGKPLGWLKELIQTLQERRLISEAKVLEFIQACQGSPEPPRLPRLRETDKTLPLAIEWRNIWHQDLYGFVLLNEMKSVTIDSQPVDMHGLSHSVRHPEFRREVQLPRLAPGKHLLRCEILYALVAETDAAGLPGNAPSENWPPARLKWTRTVEAELMVYEKDAVIVRLTEDPALNPSVTGGLSVEKVIVRRTQQGSQAVAVFKMDDSLKVPIEFDVTLRAAGKTYKLGQLWRAPIQTRSGKGISYHGTELVAQIEALAPDVQTATLVLTPNPKVMERLPDVDQIWGKEIVMEQVPLARHDLVKVTSTEAQPE